MRSSDTIADLAAALAKAQGAFVNPEKDREVSVATKAGGEYKFKYATFTAVVDSVRKPLSDNGLSFVQITGWDEQGALLTTRLLHSTGQWIEFDTPVFVGGPGAQAFGSGLTYAKRYALAAMLGVTADMDEDGNETDGNKIDMRERPTRGMATDPIAAARREMDPRGQKPNQYRTDQDAKWLADWTKWTDESIAEVGKLPTEKAIEKWFDINAKALADLERDYPALWDRLSVAVDARRDAVPQLMNT